MEQRVRIKTLKTQSILFCLNTWLSPQLLFWTELSLTVIEPLSSQLQDCQHLLQQKRLTLMLIWARLSKDTFMQNKTVSKMRHTHWGTDICKDLSVTRKMHRYRSHSGYIFYFNISLSEYLSIRVHYVCLKWKDTHTPAQEQWAGVCEGWYTTATALQVNWNLTPLLLPWHRGGKAKVDGSFSSTDDHACGLLRLFSSDTRCPAPPLPCWETLSYRLERW